MINITLLFVLCILVASNVFGQDESFYLPGSEIVDAELREIILNEHNRFRRNFHVPTMFQWDHTLELFAQLRARELKLSAPGKEFDHRNYKDSGIEGGTYGECLSVSRGQAMTVKDLTVDAIYQWKNETSKAMDLRDVPTELESSPPLARVIQINDTLVKKTNESLYEYGHALEMLRWYSTRIGCSYSIGTGRTSFWDFNFVCEYSIEEVPEIPKIAWNAPLFDLVNDETAASHPASRISVTRGLENPNAYIPLNWNLRKKTNVQSLTYKTLGYRDPLKLSPKLSLNEIIQEQRRFTSAPRPATEPAQEPAADPAPARGPDAARARLPREAPNRLSARPARLSAPSIPSESAPKPKAREAARPAPSEPRVPPSSQSDKTSQSSAPGQGPMDASKGGARSTSPAKKPAFVSRPQVPRKPGQACRIQWGPVCIP